MIVTAADFEEWRQHPVTEALLSLFEAYADEQQAEWMRASWVSGKSDPMLLLELRTRADAYRAISELTPDRVAELQGDAA